MDLDATRNFGINPRPRLAFGTHPLPPMETTKNRIMEHIADGNPSLEPCAPAPLLLHGRQVPRLLHHHHRLLARPDRRHLRRLLDRPLPAHRWQGPSDRGLLFPPEVNETRDEFSFLSC